MKTLIKNAKVITMSDKYKEVEELDIVIEDDKISFLGRDYNDNVDEVIDAKEKIVLPGLINCHTHLGMSLFRASNDDYSLMDWLNNYIWPVEDKLTDEDMYYTTLLSTLEMIKTGTTCCNDMYFRYNGVLKAIEESKIRGFYGRCLMQTADLGKERLEEYKEIYKEYKDKNPLIRFTVTPHSMYTCDTDYLKECEKLATEYNLPIHIHLAENKKELQDIKDLHNKNYVEVLEDTNLINHKLIIAHGTYFDDTEKLKGKDISICTNPLSNLDLGCGIANLTKLKKEGFNLCIGTDGQGSGNNLNMFYHMSLVDYLQKAKYEDPTVMSSYDVLKMATINGAKALGIDNEIGSLEEGKKADLIILDLNDITLTPTLNLISQIVHNAWFDTVDTTFVNGVKLYSNKQFNLDININELKNKVIEIKNKYNL